MCCREETALYQKGIDKHLDQRFEQLQKKRLWQGQSFVDALSAEEILILRKLWKKFKFKYRHLSFGDVSKLVELATDIEDCRLSQKNEQTRTRMARWRKNKGKTKLSKVHEATRKVQPSRISKKMTSVRQRSRRRVNSGVTGKSKKKKCVKQRKDSVVSENHSDRNLN